MLPNIQNISFFIFIIITSICCIWQFISLVQLYLTYPTTVQIDTQFDVHKNSLSGFTLCKNIKYEENNHFGKSSDDLFEYYSKVNMTSEISLHGPNIGVDVDSLLTLIPRLSLDYFCTTFQGIPLDF